MKQSVHLVIVIAFIIIAAASFFLVSNQGQTSQCTSLDQCLIATNTMGNYEAVYHDSYSSPGGTATTEKKYSVGNDKITACISCMQIFTSGYGNSTSDCPEGWNCNDVLKQADIIGIVSHMESPVGFVLEERQCFKGTTEGFESAVCFDKMNRIVNYAEQGKRPSYAFSVSGYETEIPF